MCVVSDEKYRGNDRCLVVPDVLETLQQLAKYHRKQLTIPIIGITGTNGKTTTKELVHAVLSRRYRTSATSGNFNNHLGVPLTLLSIPADAEIAIVEMGANHPGEIEQLCNIADPRYGLITNVGRAHLEGFGSFEGVVHTKTELYRHLSSHNGTIFVNADNERLMQEAQKCVQTEIVTYGNKEGANIRGTYVGSDPYMHLYFEQGDNVYNVHSNLLGAYNFDNAMAAVCVGMRFGVEPFEIKQAIEEYQPSNRRSQFKQTEHNCLYLDCYNANPSSMAPAIGTFSELKADHKMAIIGGMRELGTDSAKEHQHLLDMLNEAHLEKVILTGSEFDGLSLPPNMVHFHSTQEVIDTLRQQPPEGFTILVKGSNGNALWKLEEYL